MVFLYGGKPARIIQLVANEKLMALLHLLSERWLTVYQIKHKLELAGRQ